MQRAGALGCPASLGLDGAQQAGRFSIQAAGAFTRTLATEIFTQPNARNSMRKDGHFLILDRATVCPVYLSLEPVHSHGDIGRQGMGNNQYVVDH